VASRDKDHPFGPLEQRQIACRAPRHNSQLPSIAFLPSLILSETAVFRILLVRPRVLSAAIVGASGPVNGRKRRNRVIGALRPKVRFQPAAEIQTEALRV
jgi:hypothetical protein